MSAYCTLEVFLWVLMFLSYIQPVHCCTLLKGSEALFSLSQFQVWLGREHLTALWFGLVIFHLNTSLWVLKRYMFALILILSRSGLFTVNSHFGYINRSIQLSLSALMTAVMRISAGISHYTTNYQHDIGFFSVGWKTLAAHCHKSFHLNVSTGEEI